MPNKTMEVLYVLDESSPLLGGLQNGTVVIYGLNGNYKNPHSMGHNIPEILGKWGYWKLDKSILWEIGDVATAIEIGKLAAKQEG